jgi:bisphosphoglycerate-dependent phosphoglycerate mutase
VLFVVSSSYGNNFLKTVTNICFDLQIIRQLLAGKHVMIVAYGNSLLSIIMHPDKLSSQEVI